MSKVSNSNNPIFYVYVYLDPRNPGNYVYGEYKFEYEPFYVGKGSGRRAYVHLYSNKCNKDFFIKIKEISQPLVIFYKEGLDEYSAYMLEDKMTRVIGRLNIGTGPLNNIIDGGGAGGNVGYKHTDESKQKIRNSKIGVHRPKEVMKKTHDANKGLKRTNEVKQKMSIAQKGHIVTEETKQKIREKRKLQIITPETRKKLSESHKGKKHTEESKRKMSISQKNRRKHNGLHL